MELSLQIYFDLGVSYGLGDSAFAPIQDGQRDPKVPDIRGIGISDPLGLGRVSQLTNATRMLWRRVSVDKVDVPEMELGFEGSTPEFPGAPATFEEYKSSLKSLIEMHDFTTCEITVYGIGIGFLRVDFKAGVPLPLANGLRRCFEYAAYSEKVSNAILKEAQDLTQECLPPRGWWQRFLSWFKSSRTNIAALSKRPPPEVQTDEHDYSESRLFTGFTCVALCTDESDNIEAIKERLWRKNRTVQWDLFKNFTLAIMV
jgi:hypothetical protein